MNHTELPRCDYCLCTALGGDRIITKAKVNQKQIVTQTEDDWGSDDEDDDAEAAALRLQSYDGPVLIAYKTDSITMANPADIVLSTENGGYKLEQTKLFHF